MKFTLRKVLLLEALLIALTVFCSPYGIVADEVEVPEGWVCWSLNFGGLVLGVSNESHVIRLLGDGYIERGQGGNEARYYVDESKMYTMVVKFTTDQRVGEIDIFSGMHRLVQNDTSESAKSVWFDPKEGFGNYHAIQLGAQMKEVIENLGTPEKRIDDDTLRYRSIAGCELESYLYLHFEDSFLKWIKMKALAG